MKTKQTKENYTNLVEKALQGDKKAKEQLYVLTNKSAYFVALKMTKNENDAMDILQDSYLKAFSSLDKLENPEKFNSWFNCIVANNCRNFLKKKTPDFFSDLSDEDSGEDFEPEDKNAELPSEYSANREIREIVHNAINNLPEEQRLCVMMYYFDELSVQQIADALEISAGTVKSRLNYARKKIRAELETLESKGYSLRGICISPIISNALGSEMTALSVPAALSATVLGGSAAATAAAVTGISAVTKVAVTIIACVVVTGGAVGAYRLATKDNGNSVQANAAVSQSADETDSVVVTASPTATTTVTTTSKATTTTKAVVKVSEIKAESFEVMEEAEYKINAAVNDDAEDKALIYETSDKSIATVDENGRVKGIQEGECKITITSKDGGCSVEISVTVKDKFGTKDIESRTVYSTGCNFRTGPSTDYDVIEYLEVNTKITIIGETGDWYKATVDGKTGFVGKSVVQDSEITVNNPSNNGNNGGYVNNGGGSSNTGGGSSNTSGGSSGNTGGGSSGGGGFAPAPDDNGNWGDGGYDPNYWIEF